MGQARRARRTQAHVEWACRNVGPARAEVKSRWPRSLRIVNTCGSTMRLRVLAKQSRWPRPWPATCLRKSFDHSDLFLGKSGWPAFCWYDPLAHSNGRSLDRLSQILCSVIVTLQESTASWLAVDSDGLRPATTRSDCYRSSLTCSRTGSAGPTIGTTSVMFSSASSSSRRRRSASRMSTMSRCR